MRTIVVADYDATWSQAFEQLRARTWQVVSDVALSIEHVGSTSVPGLPAKPTIDISMIVEDQASVPLAIERLTRLGYVHRGNLGIEGREAFEGPNDPPHNLYLCPRNSPAIANHIAIRDYLRAHPDAAKEYGELKRQLARQYPHDVDGYIHGKTDFLLRVLRACDLPAEHLEALVAQIEN